MTWAKQWYDEYCEYCTIVVKYCDRDWKENCLETADHILCRCPFSTLSKNIYSHIIWIGYAEIFKNTKHIKNNRYNHRIFVKQPLSIEKTHRVPPLRAFKHSIHYNVISLFKLLIFNWHYVLQVLNLVNFGSFG